MERNGTKEEHEYVPLVDIFETADSHVIEFELPGFDIRDLQLSTCCNTLILEGIKRREHPKRRFRFIRVERHFGHFSRIMEIPPMADISAVRAKYANGTLSVIFPYLKDRQNIIKNICIECD
jgi:HSP20 family protein